MTNSSERIHWSASDTPMFSREWFKPMPYVDIEVRVKRRWWQRKRILTSRVLSGQPSGDKLALTIMADLLESDISS